MSHAFLSDYLEPRGDRGRLAAPKLHLRHSRLRPTVLNKSKEITSAVMIRRACKRQYDGNAPLQNSECSTKILSPPIKVSSKLSFFSLFQRAPFSKERKIIGFSSWNHPSRKIYPRISLCDEVFKGARDRDRYIIVNKEGAVDRRLFGCRG